MSEETSSVKYYSLAEIAVNDGTNGNGTWIIYKDNVYDVTAYLDDHPGGGDLITEWAGKDCTKAFDDFGHSGDAKKEMKTMKIGEVREEERKKEAEEERERQREGCY
ncbi:hypothetical protein NQ317_015444 [Molorchus minor]|uniref:Cytochrome b5 n=1 Tax=Molorchus minor TaxID=1323400 RepID=A0ABQ9JTZ9_9CUCU|nr:hypothetical protein NQ317_015444 [Molorchus minor]